LKKNWELFGVVIEKKKQTKIQKTIFLGFLGNFLTDFGDLAHFLQLLDILHLNKPKKIEKILILTIFAELHSFWVIVAYHMEAELKFLVVFVDLTFLYKNPS
jgi:hypothetical protein